MDGMGARGGASGAFRQDAAAGQSAESETPHEDWQPSHAVDDMVLEYRNRLNQTPEDHSTRFALALAYLYAQHFRQAARELEIVVQAMPEYADAYYRLALCRAKLGMPESALDAARCAGRIEPANKRYRALLQALEQEAPDAP